MSLSDSIFKILFNVVFSKILLCYNPFCNFVEFKGPGERSFLPQVAENNLIVRTYQPASDG